MVAVTKSTAVSFLRRHTVYVAVAATAAGAYAIYTLRSDPPTAAVVAAITGCFAAVAYMLRVGKDTPNPRL